MVQEVRDVNAWLTDKEQLKAVNKKAGKAIDPFVKKYIGPIAEAGGKLAKFVEKQYAPEASESDLPAGFTEIDDSLPPGFTEVGADKPLPELPKEVTPSSAYQAFTGLAPRQVYDFSAGYAKPIDEAYRGTEPMQRGFRDVPSEMLQQAGYEPDFSEQIERLSEYGMGQFARGAASGATFGLTEHVPLLKPEENIGASAGKVAGSVLPLSKLMDAVGVSAANLAMKSPILRNQINSFLNMTYTPFVTGALATEAESLIAGEQPSAGDIFKHGTMWAALDMALKGMGASYRFGKGLLGFASKTGSSTTSGLIKAMDQAERAGVDMSNPEKVAMAVMDIFESAPEQATKKLMPAPIEESAVERLSKQSIAQQAVTPANVRNKKITDEPVNRLMKDRFVLSEPYTPSKVSLVAEAEALEETALSREIENIGEKAASKEELGTRVKSEIEQNFEDRRQGYRELYDVFNERTAATSTIPLNTAREAGELLKRITKVKTKPPGYKEVINTLETVLEDAGFQVVVNKAGEIDNIISVKDVFVDDLSQLAVRLNEIADYEVVNPSAKKYLKSVAAAAKKDVRVAVRGDSEAAAAFDMAEAEYGDVARKYGRDSITGIRKQEAGELVAGRLNKPTTMKDLKEILTPDQYLNLEREMLEELQAKDFKAARKMLREFKGQLSEGNKKLAEEIVASKDPHNPVARDRLAQRGILEEMSQSMSNGTRPNKTLNLWKNPKGRKLVRDTFKDGDNWPEIENYLQRQSFDDMISSVIDQGKLDLAKYNNVVNRTTFLEDVKAQGGSDAYDFFKNLDSMVKQFQRNVKLLDTFPSKERLKSSIEKGEDILKKAATKLKTKPVEYEKGIEILKPAEKASKTEVEEQKAAIERGRKILKRMAAKDFPVQAKAEKAKEWVKETFGLSEKATLSLFSLMKMGVPNSIATMVGYRMFNGLLTKPAMRKTFRMAVKQHGDPVLFLMTVGMLGEYIKAED